MKKNAIFLVIFALPLLIWSAVFSEDADWQTSPVITHVFEMAKEKIYVEWEGGANLYEVYVDGNVASTVNLNYTILDIKNGNHQISVMPIDSVSKEGNKNLSFNLDLGGESKSNLTSKILDTIGFSGFSAGLDVDLSALGIDPKDVVRGKSSEIFRLKYKPSQFSEASPEVIGLETDFNDRLKITFTDKYDSDAYIISIKNGNDINRVEFDRGNDSGNLISKENTQVTILLDPAILSDQGCMIPELDNKYGFSVTLMKYPANFIDGTKETNALLESKESKYFDYTPYAAWKNAPIITYASQTDEGQVTIQWEHESQDLDCSYKIMKIDMLMGVKTKEEEIASSSQKQVVINDLLNGKYTYTVIPVLQDDQGFTSESVSVEVHNNWVAAPALTCEKGNGNNIILRWDSIEGVEDYHITVSVGSGSILRFVNLDYKKHEEIDVKAKNGTMEYIYQYDPGIGSENEINFKFDIYGSRSTADNSQQKSASTSKTITVTKN